MHQNYNPLSKHFRQPKIYVSFPSKGAFYSPSSFEKNDTGKYPVLAMTAKDEIKFKTPDALLNGQATVDVIQSCVPNIKNAWELPVIDLDAILIAIRIATYGEKMDVTIEVPGSKEERTYSVELPNLLDQLIVNEYNNIVESGDFKIEIAPLTYKNFTDTAIKTFEEQRLVKMLNDDRMNDLERLDLFNKSFNRLTDMNISIVSNSVVSVQYLDEPPVTNKEHINEFFENSDNTVFQKVLKHVEEERKKFSIKPFEVLTTAEDRAAGAPEKLSIPISFDQSNFFVRGS
jgi:hypothetical protein